MSSFHIVTPYKGNLKRFRNVVPLFKVFNHPLAPSSVKHMFIMFLDTTYVGMLCYYNAEKSLMIPFAHMKDLESISTSYLMVFQQQNIKKDTTLIYEIHRHGGLCAG